MMSILSAIFLVSAAFLAGFVIGAKWAARWWNRRWKESNERIYGKGIR